MFGLVGKGFCGSEKGIEGTTRGKGTARGWLKAVAHEGNATRGLFASLPVDIAQLKSTSVVTP